jgi:hypothetical protein
MDQLTSIATRLAFQEKHFGTFSGALIKSPPWRPGNDSSLTVYGLHRPADERSVIERLIRNFALFFLGSNDSTASPAPHLDPLPPQTEKTKRGVVPEGAVARVPDWLFSHPGQREKGASASWSHYNQPIESATSVLGPSVLAAGKSERPPTDLHGNSRRWGDAPRTIQLAVIDEIVSQAASRGWSTRQVAFALALARVESGFNPDAAARSTSASGVGQIVDKTAKALGLPETERFSISANISAMLSLIEQNKKLAQNLTAGDLESPAGLALQYGLYHDGPGLKYGGEKIARESVLPWVERIYQWLTKPPIAVHN